MPSAGWYWLLSFLGTLVIELPVYTWATTSVFGFARALAIGVALNVATHPLMWGVHSLLRHPYLLTFLVAEAVVWATEAILLKTFSHRRRARRVLGWSEALAISFAANAFSAGAGLLF